MRILGRLLLFAVGGVLLYLSITSIISNWSTIQSIGWDNFFSSDTWTAVKSILIQVFYALCALYAIFLGLKGKATFISFIAAVVLTVIVVSRTIDFVNSDTEKTVENIVNPGVTVRIDNKELKVSKEMHGVKFYRPAGSSEIEVKTL